MTLGLSSVWRSLKIRDGRQLVERLQSFTPISGIELEYRVLPETAAAIAELARSGAATVLSVHNYCPHPSVLPPDRASGDAFLLSSPDPDQRRLALAYTRKTMEFASDVGARTVVLHLGRVEMEEPMDKLKAFHSQGMCGSPAWEELMSRFRGERKARQEIYLETVMRNLSELLPLASRLGIQLGLENRYYLREIPDVEETGILLDAFRGGPVGHWHDMGHSAVQGNLGVQEPLEWLSEHGESLVGAHIHDTRGVDDHLAPGEGKTDFASLLPCFRPGVVKILELRPSVSPAAAQHGITLAEELCRKAKSFPNGEHTPIETTAGKE